MADATKPYRIVVGVDYSEIGTFALEQALEIGANHGNAEVHVLNVVSLAVRAPMIDGGPPPEVSGMTFEEAGKALTQYVDGKMGETRGRLGQAAASRFPRVIAHLRVDVPAQELAQLAADLEADLVVVGTHGRRGLSRVLLGSVAEAVVRLAPCPVLVVRKKRLVTVATIEPPCPECVKVREATHGDRYWCNQHSQHHGQRHTYHGSDRVSQDGTMPLLYHFHL